MFAGMQFCPHCGAKAARAIADSGQTLTCPGCGETMHAVRVGSTPMFECGSCSSVWLDAATFTQLCTDREERGTVAATISRAPVGVVPTAGKKVRYVRCPICKNTLNRENFGRQSGVIIDVCKQDGVWFERDELHSVLAFIDGGGMERARALENARQAADRVKLEQEFTESGRRFVHRTTTTTTTIHVEHSADSFLDDALRALFSA